MSISSEWAEIETDDLIKIKKDNHFVSIVLEPPLESGTPKGGIKTPDGRIMHSDIRIIDAEGKDVY